MNILSDVQRKSQHSASERTTDRERRKSMTVSIRDNPGVVAPPPLIYAGTLAIGLLVHLFFPVKFFPKVGATLIGRICTTIAGTLALSAFFEMRRAGTHVN